MRKRKQSLAVMRSRVSDGMKDQDRADVVFNIPTDEEFASMYDQRKPTRSRPDWVYCADHRNMDGD